MRAGPVKWGFVLLILAIALAALGDGGLVSTSEGWLHTFLLGAGVFSLVAAALFGLYLRQAITTARK